MTTNMRYTIKAAQPAAQAQPLAEKVLSQLLAELAAELVQLPTRIIRSRIAVQAPSLQPLAELKWSRHFA